MQAIHANSIKLVKALLLKVKCPVQFSPKICLQMSGLASKIKKQFSARALNARIVSVESLADRVNIFILAPV